MFASHEVLGGVDEEHIVQRFAAETVTVAKELTDPAKGEIFFLTPAGQAKLAEMQARFDRRYDAGGTHPAHGDGGGDAGLPGRGHEAGADDCRASEPAGAV